MPAISATAPGKVILFGEHAVVYGQPAIAVPVTQVRARAVVTAKIRGEPGAVDFEAPDIGLKAALKDLPADHPLAIAAGVVLQSLGESRPPALSIRVTSTIPVAGGLGSGAAVSVAVIRALSAFLGRPLPDDVVSTLAYEVEKRHHGTPSGIDNTVVTVARPVFYVRGQPIGILSVPVPFTLVIADTGIQSLTADTVRDVRLRREQDPGRYNRIFETIGEIAQTAREAIEAGDVDRLGPLMDRNQALLEDIGVSSPELERLIAVARIAGAEGAKLSGGGRGGNMIAITSREDSAALAAALLASGAVRTIVTEVRSPDASSL